MKCTWECDLCLGTIADSAVTSVMAIMTVRLIILPRPVSLYLSLWLPSGRHSAATLGLAPAPPLTLTIPPGEPLTPCGFCTRKKWSHFPSSAVSCIKIYKWKSTKDKDDFILICVKATIYITVWVESLDLLCYTVVSSLSWIMRLMTTSKAAHISSPLGIICSLGRMNPWRPVSRSSVVKEKRVPSAPLYQSSLAPAAGSVATSKEKVAASTCMYRRSGALKAFLVFTKSYQVILIFQKPKRLFWSIELFTSQKVILDYNYFSKHGIIYQLLLLLFGVAGLGIAPGWRV